MTHTYEFTFSLDACKLLPKFGKVIDEVNDSMRSFGFEEKLGVRSQCLTATLSGCRPLTDAEARHAGEMIADAYREKLPQYDIRLESYREISTPTQED
jgi:hypothetical protein